MQARGCIVGLTRGTRRVHIIRAAQESIAYQSYDLVAAMESDTGLPIASLKVDGGASRDAFLMQFHADVLDKPLVPPMNRDYKALGAAYQAGLATGIWNSREDILKMWRCDLTFNPQMSEDDRKKTLKKWHKAVNRSLGWAED